MRKSSPVLTDEAEAGRGWLYVLQFSVGEALHQYARLAALLRKGVVPFAADDDGVSEVVEDGVEHTTWRTLKRCA